MTVQTSVIDFVVSEEPRRTEEMTVCSEQNDDDQTPGDDNSSKSDQSLALQWEYYGDAPFKCQQDESPGRQLDKRQQDTHTHVPYLSLFHEIQEKESLSAYINPQPLSNDFFFDNNNNNNK